MVTRQRARALEEERDDEREAELDEPLRGVNLRAAGAGDVKVDLVGVRVRARIRARVRARVRARARGRIRLRGRLPVCLSGLGTPD